METYNPQKEEPMIDIVRTAKLRAFSEKHAKSLCKCWHTGDGGNSQHGGINGHGACTLCDCKRFTWRQWTTVFEKLLERIANL